MYVTLLALTITPITKRTAIDAAVIIAITFLFFCGVNAGGGGSNGSKFGVGTEMLGAGGGGMSGEFEGAGGRGDVALDASGLPQVSQNLFLRTNSCPWVQIRFGGARATPHSVQNLSPVSFE